MEAAITDIGRGAAAALSKWDQRVKITLNLCKQTEILRPRN